MKHQPVKYYILNSQGIESISQNLEIEIKINDFQQTIKT